MAAWLVGNQLPGDLSRYAYAAALGAFVATGTTVLTIARTSAQQAVGLVIGAGIGLAVLPLEAPGLVKIGVIAAVGVLLQGSTTLGPGAKIVPVAAVLVILFGGVDADGYAVGYVGQFSLGMLVGTLVNAVVVPPLHDRQARERIRVAVDELAGRVDELAEMLRGPWPPDRDDWRSWGPELEDWMTELAEELREARESQRLNPRSLWRRHDLERDADDLARLRGVVRRSISIIDALSGAAWSDPVKVHLRPEDRVLLADAVAGAATHLRAWSGGEGLEEASAASGATIEALYAGVTARREPESGAGAAVFALRAIRERIDGAVNGAGS